VEDLFPQQSDNIFGEIIGAVTKPLKRQRKPSKPGLGSSRNHSNNASIDLDNNLLGSLKNSTSSNRGSKLLNKTPSLVEDLLDLNFGTGDRNATTSDSDSNNSKPGSRRTSVSDKDDYLGGLEFGSLLKAGNRSTTSTSSSRLGSKLNSYDGLSPEARRLLDIIPDLSFMTADTLMTVVVPSH
jgi:hypothetical protein